MNRKQLITTLALMVALLAVLTVGICMTEGGHHDVKEMMKDAVLHEVNQVSFLGLTVNPAVVSAYCVTAAVLLAAALIRIFVIPRFREIPGRFQLLLEMAVGLFDDMARSKSHHHNKILGGYLFGAGGYIFVSTLFELLGLQVMSTAGHSVALPAPLADINGAIAMGLSTYLFLMLGGVCTVGFTGVGRTLKEFSLPISMSFRLFGALLSGLLVTELVYSYMMVSFVIPVAVAILFTLLHAVVQTYVLTMLTSMFYGEITEPAHPKAPKRAPKKC